MGVRSPGNGSRTATRPAQYLPVTVSRVPGADEPVPHATLGVPRPSLAIPHSSDCRDCRGSSASIECHGLNSRTKWIYLSLRSSDLR